MNELIKKLFVKLTLLVFCELVLIRSASIASISIDPRLVYIASISIDPRLLVYIASISIDRRVVQSIASASIDRSAECSANLLHRSIRE